MDLIYSDVWVFYHLMVIVILCYMCRKFSRYMWIFPLVNKYNAYTILKHKSVQHVHKSYIAKTHQTVNTWTLKRVEYEPKLQSRASITDLKLQATPNMPKSTSPSVSSSKSKPCVIKIDFKYIVMISGFFGR